RQRTNGLPIAFGVFAQKLTGKSRKFDPNYPERSKDEEGKPQGGDGEHHRQDRRRHQEKTIELFGSEFPQHDALMCWRRKCSGLGVVSVKQITLHAGCAHAKGRVERHFEAPCRGAATVISNSPRRGSFPPP